MASLDRLTPARRIRLEKLLSIPNLASKYPEDVRKILGCGKSSLWDDLSVLRRSGRLPTEFHLMNPRMQKQQKLLKLRSYIDQNSGMTSQGDIAKALGVTVHSVKKGLRELRKRGDLPPGFRPLGTRESAFIKARAKRKPQLIHLYGLGKTLRQIASEMGSNTHMIGVDLGVLREANDPSFIQAERRRASTKPPTTDEVQRRQTALHKEEIRTLEKELGRTIQEQSFLNNVHYFKSEILRVCVGLPVPTQDLRTLSKMGIAKYFGKDHPPPTHYLTPAAKAALWDLGVKNPAPIRFKQSEATQANAEDSDDCK